MRVTSKYRIILENRLAKKDVYIAVTLNKMMKNRIRRICERMYLYNECSNWVSIQT